MTKPDTLAPLLPLDEHNRKLQANVHPLDWENPEPQDVYHLVVLGAGTAGLVTAAGAAGLGARVALVEQELMGGDCLNVGCVPSKGMIGAARAVAAVNRAAEFGVRVPDGTHVDFAESMERMRRLRSQISPADSAERFAGMGIDVYFGQARFLGGDKIHVDRNGSSGGGGSGGELRFRKAVIATGARASAPPIDGLNSVPYLTNETLFSLTELPERLGIIGGGPIGAEMAQTFARFGSSVHLFEQSDHILSREDRDAAAIVQNQFERDGVQLMLGTSDLKTSPTGEDQVQVAGKRNGDSFAVIVDRLLVAVGRAPNTESLNLEAVDVQFDQHGIDVNDQLRTTNPKIYAAGDVCSKYKFTHAADFQARIVIQNALFSLGPFGKRKVSQLVIPWATYTSPELAHVGLYADEAEKQGMQIDTYTQSFEHVDRAILDGADAGFVRVHTKKGTDEIVGATIVAENAGDLISEIVVAMTNGLGLSKIGSSIHPYPTQAEAIRKLGDQYNKTRLTPLSQKLLGFLMRINVGR